MLECAPNFRDLGGYATADGATVARGRLYRSQHVGAPTETDLETLRRIGIRYVCDLRGTRERQSRPSRWPKGATPQERHLNIGVDVRAGAEKLVEILIADPTAAGVRRMMEVNYSLLPNAFADGGLGLFLDDLLEGDKFPAVVHCTAGKDRTGFVSAVLLLTLGVPMETVRHDYMLTEQLLDLTDMMANSAGYLKAVIGEQLEPDDAMLRMLCGVSPDYLTSAIDTINQDYGSVEGYLEQTAGFGPEKRERLREIMLA